MSFTRVDGQADPPKLGSTLGAAVTGVDQQRGGEPVALVPAPLLGGSAAASQAGDDS